MTKDKFYKIIEEGKVNDVFIGFWTVEMDYASVYINFVGSLENPSYSVWDDESEEFIYSDIEEILDSFIINGMPMRDQIESIRKMSCAEYID